MTREEAVKILNNRDSFGIPKGYTSGYAEAIDMAIHSLEAWNKVLKSFEFLYQFGKVEGYTIDIVNQHLKEVEND